MEKQNVYPRLVEIDVDGVFSKVFENANGNEEFCRPTGMELQESADVADHWIL